ncbi:MAG: hypothetical protein U9O89_06380 [Thermoproteota archaeon]|nr:hypothetical protein [Thermoproteota archaeon]
MSNSLKRKAENILELLDRLAAASDEGIPIIVEGQKDVDTLRKLDIRGSIVTAKTYGKSLLDVVDEVSGRKLTEVILLMDFDRRGKEWVKRLTQHLEKTGIKPNLYFWRTLLSFVGRDVKDIEGLASYMQTLQEKIGNS